MASDTKKAKVPMVEVEWVDSCSKGGWRSRAEYLEQTVDFCRTAGYLLKRGLLQI